MNRFIRSSMEAPRTAFRAGCLFGLLLFAVPAVPALGGPIPVTFRDAVVAGGATTALPFPLSNAERNVFLRFNVPDFDRILSVNSIDVTLRLFDDGDTASESGEVLFAVRFPDTDFAIGSPLGTGLDGTTEGAPLVFTHSLSPAEIALALPTLTDNQAFRIRVRRAAGDFSLLGGDVRIDAELRPVAVPAPATLACFGIGLAGLLWARFRRPSALRA